MITHLSKNPEGAKQNSYVRKDIEERVETKIYNTKNLIHTKIRFIHKACIFMKTYQL